MNYKKVEEIRELARQLSVLSAKILAIFDEEEQDEVKKTTPGICFTSRA